MPNKKKNKKKAEQPVPNIPGMGPRPPPVAAGGDAPQAAAATTQQQQQQQDDEASALAQALTAASQSLKNTQQKGEPQKPKQQPASTASVTIATAAVSKINLGSEYSELLPPQKRLDLPGQPKTFPGAAGRRCQLRTNHFRMRVPEGPVYQYSLAILPPWQRPYKRADKEIYQQVIARWRQENVVARQDPFSWVYDGSTTLYSTRHHERVPDSEVSLQLDGRETVFSVTDVKVDTTIMITQDLAHWAAKGQSGSVPQDALNAINIILSQARVLNLSYTNLGKTYFRNDGHVLDLGFGKEVWTGIFSSVRPNSWTEKGTQFLATLNANITNKAATKEMNLVKTGGHSGALSYIDELLDRKGTSRDGKNWREGMDNMQKDILSRDLKGLKVKYILPDGRKREYRCNEVKEPANKLMIPDLGITVEKYFVKEYKEQGRLRYPHLPCLWLGSRNKTIYIPLELCEVASQPLPRSKQLPDQAQAAMIRSTALRPGDRERMILEELRRNNNIHENDPFAKKFNLSIADNLVTLTGRILTPPSIEYQQEKTENINPKDPGKWFQNKGSKYVSGGELSNWAVLDLARLRDPDYSALIAEFGAVGAKVGMKIKCQEGTNVFRYSCNREEDIGKDFRRIVDDFKTYKTKLDLILVIFPFKGSRGYNEVKQLGDLHYKLPTQCCVQKVLFKAGRPNGQVISNLCLKINSKLAGTNHMLARGCRPPVLAEPVMILGADVTHAAPQHKGVKPSIAAVVGSVDPTAQMKYAVEIRVQHTEQNEEVIQDMAAIVTKLLKKFHSETKGQKPSKLIMFRDGVSEGQFQTVMARELTAIRRACEAMPGTYRPHISYIVVQKRHHTRFFPADGNKYAKNGNALAGTVVDQGINHPTEGDYYLLSHEGIQGTSRPCHYQVLWDDCRMSADTVEQLSYYLCHLYSRCTRSVSYPAPTYYSHLAADRARKHHDHLTEKERKSQEAAKEILEEEGSKANLMYFV